MSYDITKDEMQAQSNGPCYCGNCGIELLQGSKIYSVKSTSDDT